MLRHYGVKGMKWGERKTERKLRRRMAAGKKNMKLRGEMSNESEDHYDNAYREYSKALKTPSFSRRKKMERINEATEKVKQAAVLKEKTKSELLRAERIYDSDEKAYRKHIEDMISKYKPEKVKDIPTKTVELGEHYTKEVVKTGITIADLPLIGTLYTGRYISDRDFYDRENLIDEAAGKRY